MIGVNHCPIRNIISTMIMKSTIITRSIMTMRNMMRIIKNMAIISRKIIRTLPKGYLAL